MAKEDRSFSPDTVSANRTQMQGNGVGQRELDLQRAPDRDDSDRLGRQDGDAALEASDALDDKETRIGDLAQEDNPELDWGEPLAGASHGENHTRRPHKTEADRGHGRRTIQRNKEINSGRLYRG